MINFEIIETKIKIVFINKITALQISAFNQIKEGLSTKGRMIKQWEPKWCNIVYQKQIESVFQHFKLFKGISKGSSRNKFCEFDTYWSYRIIRNEVTISIINKIHKSPIIDLILDHSSIEIAIFISSRHGLIHFKLNIHV